MQIPDQIKELVNNNVPCSTLFLNGFAFIRTHHSRETGIKNTTTRLRYNAQTQQWDKFEADRFPPAERRYHVKLMVGLGARNSDLAGLFKVPMQQINCDVQASIR